MDTPREKDTLVTVDELALFLKVEVETVYRLVRARRIPFYKIGKRLRFNIPEMLEHAKRRFDN